MTILEPFPVQKKEYLVKHSAKYPPATRALLGALLEELGFKKELEALKKILNLITKYEFEDLGDGHVRVSASHFLEYFTTRV